MSRRPVIDVERDLPSRPRGLSTDALSNVFGGCNSAGSCRRDSSNCCPPMECNKQWDNSYRCSYSAWI